MQKNTTKSRKSPRTRRPSHETPKGDDIKTLRAAELNEAASLLTESDNQRIGLLILILEHVWNLRLSQVESTITGVRDLVTAGRSVPIGALRQTTRSTLRRCVRHAKAYGV